MIKVILRKGRDESLRRFHPWVFSGAIAEVQGNPFEGDIVAVHASDGSFLAYGHYQIGSIAVRVLSFDESALHPDFWVDMLSRALQVRVACGLHGSKDTDCYRLVHGEGDNLPGLIIDYYGGVCVMQAHSVGMFRAKKQISDALQKVYGDTLKAVYDKSSGTTLLTDICIDVLIFQMMSRPSLKTAISSLSTGQRARRRDSSLTRERTELW